MPARWRSSGRACATSRVRSWRCRAGTGAIAEDWLGKWAIGHATDDHVVEIPAEVVEDIEARESSAEREPRPDVDGSIGSAGPPSTREPDADQSERLRRQLKTDERPVTRAEGRDGPRQSDAERQRDELDAGQPRQPHLPPKQGCVLDGEAGQQKAQRKDNVHADQLRMTVESRDERRRGGHHRGDERAERRIDPEQRADLRLVERGALHGRRAEAEFEKQPEKLRR